MDSFNDVLTQEGTLDDSGITGDTLVNDIMHSGIKGMKWGVRRYQNKDGSLTPAGQKRYNKTLEKVRAEEKALKEKAKADKTSQATKNKIDKLNARVDALNKKKQALKDGKKLSDEAESKEKTEAEKEAEKKAYNEAKDKAIKSGSATEVLKYKGDLTPQEMQAVSNRLQWEQNMQSISAKEVAVGKSKTDKLFENMDKATNNAVTAAKAWNMTANIVNAFGNLDVSLPKIDTNITNGNRETVQKEKKDAKPKEKSALDKLKEETAWIDAQNKNREAKRAAKRHDESDAKEAAKEAAKKKAESDQSSKTSDDGGSNKTVYEGTVSGEGTSKGSSKNSQRSGKVVDADWTEVTASSFSSSTKSRGEAYVNSMLSLPAPKDTSSNSGGSNSNTSKKSNSKKKSDINQTFKDLDDLTNDLLRKNDDDLRKNR